MRRAASLLIFALLIAALPAAAQSENPAHAFAPLEAWRAAVRAGDAAQLAALYSANPPATVATPAGKSTDVREEVQFWSAMKAGGLSAVELSELQRQSSGGEEQTIFQIALTSRTPEGPRKVYVSAGFMWQKQGGTWRIVASQRTDATRLPQPLVKTDLYPADADANAEIREALARAAREHKHVLLVFGGNWCYDCHVLDAAFHTPEIAPLVARWYEVVHVDIGDFDKNLDIAHRYDMLAAPAVPALAVLDSSGRLVYAQTKHEFSAARRLSPEMIAEFLKRWKP